MQTKSDSTSRYLITGLLAAAAFTLVIALTAARLADFDVVGRTLPFAYPWRLAEPTSIARLTAWGGYLLHNLIAWAIIYLARRANSPKGERPKFAGGLRWFNWAMLATHLGGVLLHLMQSRLWYDGLAQDVPEVSALGSVALMLIVILIFETPRRGLAFGQKFRFREGFVRIARQYHGYLFSWATIYTFWYHPTEGTIGHLAGFFYMFMLFVQAALIFNRAHLNRWWTFALEAFVLIHAALVAVFQGNALWPMFAFGFGAMIVLTQMYGLGLRTWTRRGLAAGFVVAAVAVYAVMGRLGQIHEITRIPILDFGVIFLLYGLYLGGSWLANLLRRPQAAATGVD